MDTAEIQRILGHSVLDPFSILGVAQDCTADDIKAAYRTKSRLIHPDKTKHDQARPAFEKLKRAEAELMDDAKRTSIQRMMQEARRELTAEWKAEVASGKRKPEDADESSSIFDDAALAKYRSIAIDLEWKRRQQLKKQMATEGAAARRDEEQANEKQRKREADKAWEANRESRVDSWRTFQAKGSKSKHSKSKKAKLGLK